MSENHHWGVTIAINGTDILTIESNHLSGIDNIHDFEDTIETAARHLLSFIGRDASSTIDRLTAENERLVAALENISGFGKVNIANEWEHGLRDIIRSMTDCARAALPQHQQGAEGK